MADKYILKGRIAVPATTEEWSKFFESESRRVAETYYGDIRVSTVFLGLNHAFDPNSPPMIFETMIFGGDHDEYQERCSTYDEAEAMHAEACKLVLDTLASVA